MRKIQDRDRWITGVGGRNHTLSPYSTLRMMPPRPTRLLERLPLTLLSLFLSFSGHAADPNDAVPADSPDPITMLESSLEAGDQTRLPPVASALLPANGLAALRSDLQAGNGRLTPALRAATFTGPKPLSSPTSPPPAAPFRLTAWPRSAPMPPCAMPSSLPSTRPTPASSKTTPACARSWARPFSPNIVPSSSPPPSPSALVGYWTTPAQFRPICLPADPKAVRPPNPPGWSTPLPPL